MGIKVHLSSSHGKARVRFYMSSRSSESTICTWAMELCSHFIFKCDKGIFSVHCNNGQLTHTLHKVQPLLILVLAFPGLLSAIYISAHTCLKPTPLKYQHFLCVSNIYSIFKLGVQKSLIPFYILSETIFLYISFQ